MWYTEVATVKEIQQAENWILVFQLSQEGRYWSPLAS